jgi:hypothetical protein
VASRKRGDDQIVGQVGWLFADVLLGLAMFYFAIGTSVPVAALPPTATPSPTPLPTLRPNEPTRTPSPTPEPTWTPTPSPTVTATPTATPAVCGVSNQMTTVKLDIMFKDIADNNTSSIESQIREGLKNNNEYRERVSAGQLPGLVIVYSGLSDEEGRSTGKAIARAKRLENTLQLIPEFSKAGYHPKGLFNNEIGVNKIEMEIYFLVRCQ